MRKERELGFYSFVPLFLFKFIGVEVEISTNGILERDVDFRVPVPSLVSLLSPVTLFWSFLDGVALFGVCLCCIFVLCSYQ